MAKEVVLKFTMTGLKDSVKDIVAIQNSIATLKRQMASGITTEAFDKLTKEIQALEAEYTALVGTVETSNQTINSSNEEMAQTTEDSATAAGKATDELGTKQEDLATTTDKSAKKIKTSVTTSASHTSESYKRAGDNIEKFAKGIVDAVTGIALVMGSSEKDADKLGQNFTKFVGISTAVKGAIEGMTSGFDLLKNNFPSVIAAFQKLWAVMIANPIIAIVAGLIAVGTAIYSFIQANDAATESILKQNQARKEQEESLKKISKETDDLLANQKSVSEVAMRAQEDKLAYAKGELDVLKTKKTSLSEIHNKEQDIFKLEQESSEFKRKYFIEQQQQVDAQIESIQSKIKWQEAEVFLQKHGYTGERTEEEINKNTEAAEKILKGYVDNLEKLNNRHESIRQDFSSSSKESRDNQIAEEVNAAKRLEENSEAYKLNLKKKYEELVKITELEISKTQEGTDARIVEEDKAYFTRLAFMEKYKKALELSQVDIDTFKQKHYNEDRDREKVNADASIKLDKETYAAKKEEAIKTANDEVIILKQKYDNFVTMFKSTKDQRAALNTEILNAEIKSLDLKLAKDISTLNKANENKLISEEDYLKQLQQLRAKYDADTVKARVDMGKKEKAADDKDWADKLAGIQKFASKATAIFNQIATVTMGIWSSIAAAKEFDRAVKLDALEKDHEAELDSIRSAEEDKLYVIEQYANKQTAALKKEHDTQLANYDAFNTNWIETQRALGYDTSAFEAQIGEERAAMQLAQQQQEAQQKADFENQKATIKYEADQAAYAADLEIFNQQEKLKEQAFKADKNMKIAQIVISTITGAIAAFTGMAAAIPGPYGLIAGAIAAAAVTVMGAVAVAQVNSTHYIKGSAPKEPKPPKPATIGSGAGNGGGEGTFKPPSLKDTTLFGTGGGSTGSQANSKQEVSITGPVRAYVLAGDITSAQEADAALKRKVTGF